MSVIRVGSNAKYADGWSQIFGTARSAGAKKATKKAVARKGTKKTTKKAAAKKKR